MNIFICISHEECQNNNLALSQGSVFDIAKSVHMKPHPQAELQLFSGGKEAREELNPVLRWLITHDLATELEREMICMASVCT